MKKQKNIKILGIVALIMLLVLPLSYAAYTSVTSARRVVSTSNAADYLFSSNYLSILPKTAMGDNNESSQEYKYKNIPISYQAGNQMQAVYVSVCNYAQGYLAKWCDKDINYHIKFSLVDLENHQAIDNNKMYEDKNGEQVTGATILKQQYKVSEGVATSGKDTISKEYKGKVLAYQTSGGCQDMYTIFFSTKYADIVGVKVEVIAEDSSPAYADYGLGGVLCLAGYETEASSGWTGEIQEAPADEESSTKQSTEYTGFNYEVSGAGSGIVTVTWDKEKFAISDLFLKEMENYIVENRKTDSSISFRVGEEDQEDRFFIQFYRVSQPDTSETWTGIKKSFSCTFAKLEQAQ